MTNRRLLGIGGIVLCAIVLLSGMAWVRRARAEERAEAVARIKKVADAVMEHVSRNDGRFPQIDSEASLLSVLGKGGRRDLLMHPDDGERVVVTYVLPSNVAFDDLEDPLTTPVVVADYDPDCLFVGYCDGHAELLPRTPEREASLREWRENLTRLRAEDPNAPLPPPLL